MGSADRCRIKQCYGMTELGGSTHIAPEHGLDKPESIGPALPGVECRVVDNATGAEVGPGEPGELLIRCAAVMEGYRGNPAATAATIDAAAIPPHGHDHGCRDLPVLARQPHHQSRHWATASELPTVTIQGRPAPATAAGPPESRCRPADSSRVRQVTDGHIPVRHATDNRSIQPGNRP
jgi:acyl-CoA synthetase (AMP-forming)/AMP-acid ligase II